jgi:hypothetical protein
MPEIENFLKRLPPGKGPKTPIIGGSAREILSTDGALKQKTEHEAEHARPRRFTSPRAWFFEGDG